MADIKMYGFSFSWNIENFFYCPYKSIASPYFVDEKLSRVPWQLIIYPRGIDDDDCIDIMLCKVVEAPETIIDFKLEIIGRSGHLLGFSEEKNAHFNKDTLEKVSRHLVERTHLIRDTLETTEDVLTVCCHMSNTAYNVVDSLDCFARTKIVVNKLSLRLNWTKDFELRTLLDIENKLIMREDIFCPDMTEYSIYFTKLKDDVEISIHRQDFNSPQCVECKISLLDAKECEVLSISDAYFFSKYSNLWKFPPFLPVSEVKYNQSKYIKNGSMIILCDLFCSGGIESEEVIYGINAEKLFADFIKGKGISEHSLQSDIRDLLTNKILCDVKLRVNDEIIEAHKSVLVARSPLIHAMFQQDNAETQTEINIQDMDIDTLKAFINFLYCDTVDKMDYDCAKNLLIVAEKYQVLRLKEMCVSFLKTIITEKNACEIVSLADIVTHTDLKSFAVDFIADHSKDILIIPDWLPWMKNHMELATEIFQRLSEKHILI